MLNRLHSERVEKEACVAVSDASFPVPFPSGLEFNAPARGAWNIVHTGMLLPESHQIFVCARGCLRGVVLTAAEMGAMERMSWVDISEEELYNGQLEQGIMDGTAAVLDKLPKLPKAVLLFISCIQQFAGVDFPYVLSELERRFPSVAFADCYMNPTMRKSGKTPDQLMRRQLYSLLKPTEKDPLSVAVIGNDRETDSHSELFDILSGRTVMDVTRCSTWEDYQKMASSSLNIVWLPAALDAAQALENRLGTPWIYVPLAYGREEIIRHHHRLSDILGTSFHDWTPLADEADRMMEGVRNQLKDVDIEIDYTATPRPLALARRLLNHGFRVTDLYADAFMDEEADDFGWLKRHAPSLRIHSTVHPVMRFHGPHASDGRMVLTIGQKAAWFSGTRHFVNLVAGGGLYGFRGVMRLAQMMAEAMSEEKDTETVIQQKGFGLPCCAEFCYGMEEG